MEFLLLTYKTYNSTSIDLIKNMALILAKRLMAIHINFNEYKSNS
jgi:hypothetical protein